MNYILCVIIVVLVVLVIFAFSICGKTHDTIVCKPRLKYSMPQLLANVNFYIQAALVRAGLVGFGNVGTVSFVLTPVFESILKATTMTCYFNSCFLSYLAELTSICLYLQQIFVEITVFYLLE